jgi:hypothetical protein
LMTLNIVKLLVSYNTQKYSLRNRRMQSVVYTLLFYLYQGAILVKHPLIYSILKRRLHRLIKLNQRLYEQRVIHSVYSTFGIKRISGSQLKGTSKELFKSRLLQKSLQNEKKLFLLIAYRRGTLILRESSLLAYKKLTSSALVIALTYLVLI